MKKILIIFLISILAVGCNSDNKTNIENYSIENLNDYFIGKINNQDNSDKIIKKTYPQNDLMEAIYFGYGTDNYNTHFESIVKKFDVEIIRTFRNDSLPYAVFKLEEGGYCFVFFKYVHPSGITNWDIFTYVVDYAFIFNGNENYGNLKIGDTLSDVSEIDVGLELRYSLRPNEFKNSELKTYHIADYNGQFGFYEITYNAKKSVELNEYYSKEDYVIKKIKFIPNGNYLVQSKNAQYVEYPLEKYSETDYLDIYRRYTILEVDLNF